MHKLVDLGLAIILLCTPALLMAQQAAVKELEQRCEEMRENRIRPLRDAEIKKCIEDKTSDPASCRSQYQDYGNTPPRMFDDLPPCVQAREKKSATRSGSVSTTKRGETTTDVEKTIQDLTTTPENKAAASRGKVEPTSRDSTLPDDKRETSKPETSRDSTISDSKRDSTSGKSTR